MALPTKSVKALEIFATGTWNGDPYSTEDLDSMVFAFPHVGFQPVVKAGHQEGQENGAVAGNLFGAPALGYVERIYRRGSKLLADVKGIPARFADLITAGAYRRISSEIFFDYETKNGIFPRVLKAIAFLGAEIPAVTSLKDIEALFRRTPTGAVYGYRNGCEFRVYQTERRDQRFLQGDKMLKTYQSEEVCALDFIAYSAVNGDAQAGRRIQKEVDAGTPFDEIRALARRYQRGEHTPEAEAQRGARVATPKEVAEAGVVLHNATVAMLQHKQLEHSPENYRKVFADVQKDAPATAATYSRGIVLADNVDVNDDDDDDGDVKEFYESTDTEISPIVTISNLVTALPRPASNDIDFERAADAVNEFVPLDIRQRAAQERLDALAAKEQKPRPEIDDDNEGLASAAENGEYDGDSLKALCWPLTR